ncbi:putative membrane protein [Saccharothrix espanaensis DSM 44229]|uniref:Putative membrane protein n=1 Tax=Saccharothrix espanaensis (strain ATCC 51144 / DSM 44229 / JCM 9112 / NBRC 15066 / NRRL 15764) TaxID=1179773 RepID=K0JSY8_SACES|nr:putative membrane protein [Saccharothrix espanaensis DSM 44229]
MDDSTASWLYQIVVIACLVSAIVVGVRAWWYYNRRK